MTSWYQRAIRTAPSGSSLGWWLGILAMSVAGTTWGAPEYVLAGRADALAQIVVARTPSGPVSALDVLMLDGMRDRSLAGVPIDAWLHPDILESTPFRLTMKTGVERLLAYQSLAAKAGNWQPAADAVRVGSFGAAMAVWVQKVVKPQVKVVEITDPASGRTSGDVDRYYLAHPEKYLRRLRAQVRYIFMAANAVPTTGTQVRQQLEEVARDIRDHKITFEEAARKYSQTSSAVLGGLLPPFYNGTFFAEFDTQTFQLTPGKVSPVFEGPEGLYLVQLVRIWPPHNIPIAEVREDIRRTLALDDVRHYYNYLLAQLTKQLFIQNYSALWNYQNLTAPIVQIDNLKLSRPDYPRYFGNPISANYETNLADVMVNASYWTEGEEIAMDLTRLGLSEHPWIRRARELAAWPLKADHVYFTQIPAAVYTAAKAMDTIRNNKQFIQGLRSVRLIEFSIQVKPQKAQKESSPGKGGPFGLGNLTPGQSQTPGTPSAEARQLQNTIITQLSQGTLPTEPTPVKLADWARKELATPNLVADLETLQRSINATSWSGIKVLVKDKDWVDVVPGTPWYDPLKSTGVGQVSLPINVGATSCQYLVLAERPVDLRNWEAKPLLLRVLAFQIEASKIFNGEVLRVRQAKNVQYINP